MRFRVGLDGRVWVERVGFSGLGSSQ
ncbi:hypothetical protein EV643_14234, partial [Kribbella sp. VKM Ac-2527]